MTSASSGNVCPRCGKKRLVTRVYKEKTPSGYVHYKITSCSDPECQKIVDKKLNDEEKKRKAIKKEQERREKERQKIKNRRKQANSK